MSTSINDMMIAYSEDAVDFARNNFNVTLDYSEESIEKIETIATSLFQNKPKSLISKLFRKGPTEEEMETICKMLGGYISEVYRRKKRGRLGN